MSRIGKKEILIPDKVKVDLQGKTIMVAGPKGTLEFTHHPAVSVAVDGSCVNVSRSSDSKTTRALHGLTRALINNMVLGVSAGFGRNLEIVGVGYRAEMKGKNMQLLLGFSHPVMIIPPPGITLAVDGNTKISVKGCDKQLVGEVAAKIRSLRPPEPYKGKGIRYEGEVVRRKAGKTAA
jgi:large subunit ribosomal protein L6